MNFSNSNHQPLVTIVTVTYNSSKYVRDAIEGVLAQAYTNIEYIVADDCSTDETWQIIQEYKDPRIIAYRNETNLGEYPNRNKAIDLATGEYLIFIDGDDYIYPHAIDYLLNYAGLFPDAAIIIQKNYFNNIIFPAYLSPKEMFLNTFFGEKSLLTSSFTSNFFRSNILKEVGGLSLNYISGDDDIRIRISLQYQILFIQGWVSWPRETPNQASSKISIIDSISDGYDMLNKHHKKMYVNNEISLPLFESALHYKLKLASILIIKSIVKFKFLQAYIISRKMKINIIYILKNLNYKKKYFDDFEKYKSDSPYKYKNNKLN
jgi:glycosyltransferase involved in cell wall biosynthesis